MKKAYIKPITEKIETELAAMLCRASQYTLNRYDQ